MMFDWDGRETWAPLCLYPHLSTRITAVHHHAQLLSTCILGIQTQVLWLVWQPFSLPSHLLNPEGTTSKVSSILKQKLPLWGLSNRKHHYQSCVPVKAIRTTGWWQNLSQLRSSRIWKESLARFPRVDSSLFVLL